MSAHLDGDGNSRSSWQPGPTPVFGDVLPSNDATALEDDLRILRAACRGEWRAPDAFDRKAQIRAHLDRLRTGRAQAPACALDNDLDCEEWGR